MAVKINSLELENVKRIKAVRLEPDQNGLYVIGGNNNQGKTSVIDAIAWALGGEKFRPSKPEREGSTIPPNLKVTLSNGIVVERKGRNSALKVTDPSGKRSGQALLDSFIGKLALDLPKFMNATSKEKADILLKIIGVGDQLDKLEYEEKSLYQERLMTGRVADQKRKFANEMTYYPGVPEEPVSAQELIRRQQEILAINGENQRKRKKVDQYSADVQRLTDEVEILKEKLEMKQRLLDDALVSLATAKTAAADLADQSTEELESDLAEVEETNRKVRANAEKKKADSEANAYLTEYTGLTAKIEDVRKKKKALLEGADLPLPGLSVDEGELTYNGIKWDGISGSDQLKIATAIVRKLNPECGFVLLDKLEQMDIPTLNRFSEWLESEGLQVIATRVSTGDECSIIIEDGYVVKDNAEKKEQRKAWKEGEF